MARSGLSSLNHAAISKNREENLSWFLKKADGGQGVRFAGAFPLLTRHSN
jgi:hypothetical protein